MGKGMKAGKKPKQPKMGNAQQMAQMQAMQQEMDKVQAEIDEMEATATAGGGAVTVTVTGKKELKDIQIQPDVVDPDDVEMLQDLVTAAINEAMRMSDEDREKTMGAMAPGGMGGLF